MKPNILFLVIDGLRADTCYEKSKAIIPNINHLMKIEIIEYYLTKIIHLLNYNFFH